MQVSLLNFLFHIPEGVNRSFKFLLFVFRKLFGRFGLWSSAFIPSFFANLVAISIERPARRPALAVYVSNVVCNLWF